LDTVPVAYELRAPNPNPILGSTLVSFALPEASDASLRVYDLQGRLVRELLRGQLPAGEHTVQWDGRNENGEAISHGIYFLQLITPRTRSAQKVVVLR
jgi:flagellar hook assembly protein FlgD